MFCINPNCSHPKNSDKHLFCITCGSELLLNGRYRVIRLLSDKGGFAVTYEVTHNDVHKVLKVLNNDHPDAVRLFEQEANILTQLNHPGIPKGEGEFIYFPRDSQTPIHCFVMEKIEGMDLEEYQRNRQFRPIDEKLALEWLKQLVEILDVVHSNNFFHRDIKPSNIIFQPNGQLSLIDFGVVRQVTATIMSNNKNTGIYTPGYAPPEQEKGFAVPQSDFYALGRTFVYLLTGKEPTDADIYDPHNDELNWRKFAGDISEELADFLDILMARKATQRPANTQVILQTLSSYLGEKILIVCQTGIGKYHYKSISEAIKNAKPGTKIMVRPGTYKEGLVINKEVEIIGDGLRENIIIESTESDCILMETDKALVKGLTLRGKAGTNNNKYSTVDIPQGKLILDDCDITSDSLSCIAIHGVAANPTIRNCQIHDGKESGVYVYNKGQATVDNCDIFSNTLSGIEIKEEGNVLIRNCQIHDNKQAGVNVYNKGQGTVDNCDIFSNFNSGIAIREEGNPTIRNCQIHDNKKAGVFVYNKGQGTVKNCDIFSNTLSGIAIREEGNPTIRNCQIHDGKKDGVYVYNKGQGIVDNCDIFSNTLSGIEIKEEGNVLIRNCQIHDGKQSGVCVYNKGQETVENCEIFSNSLAGIEIKEEGNPTIRNCQIHDGKQSGVYVHNKGQGTVENCEIFSNSLAGIEIKEEGNPTIRNCQIHDGKQSGVYVYNKGQGTVENCEIFANTYSQIDIKKYCKIQVIQSKVNGKIVNKSSSRKNIIFVGIISIILILILLTLL